jgi:aspartyl-tRNA(Asn)/glutamyl-tRNA(Gln) amidotransferase subunit A
MAASPRLSGKTLAAVARLTRGRVGARAVQHVLRTDLRADQLAALPDELRGEIPLDNQAWQARPPRTPESQGLPLPAAPWAGTSSTFTEAYAKGELSPVDVAMRALREARKLAAMRPSVGPLCAYNDEGAKADAEAATARYQSGRPRGPWDGVPVVVKEQMAVRGLPRQSGATYVDPSPQREDATCVERLRAAGAVVLGLGVMTEWGMTPTGVNSKRSMPKNPHHTDCLAGGSSTGSAVAVATGLVPMALGADGGGSIRIPSAINGVFGIKPTWGRVSRAGDSTSGSVAHVGPIASSTVDLARALETVAAPDAKDPETRLAAPIPASSLVRALGRGVRGLSIAVVEHEWRDASPEVARAGQAALAALEKEGARLVPTAIELARFAPPIGYLTIGCEARAALRAEWRDHKSEMTLDLQVSFAALDAFRASEFLDAQRLRAGLRREVRRTFGEVDLLALPSVVAPAAKVSEAEMQSGMLDAKVLDGLCRFAFLGNLTGLPAGSAPVGKDPEGRPLGLQLVGDAWDEATVLAAMAHLERIQAARVERPQVSVRVRAD